MRWPRLRPPPLLCDCTRPATRLERLLWWLRARLHRLWFGRQEIAFITVQIPTFYKGPGMAGPERFSDSAHLRRIIEDNTVKSKETN